MTDLTGPSRSRLSDLLKEYNEYPERQADVDARIDREFARQVAIMVIDSCGFSRSVSEYGIVNFLARLERLERLIAPMIQHHGGRVLRVEADNIYALFPDATSAIGCAAEVQRSVEIANEPLPKASEIYVAIGVGYGRLLLVEDDDAYGHEMNVACKLGEDLAKQGEVLVTEGAREALGGSSTWELLPLPVAVSGLELTAYMLVR